MRTYTTSQGTTVHLKDASVDMESVDSTVVDPIIDAAAPLYDETPQELVVTSAADGTHSAGSLHYEGQALDLRVWDVPDHEALARRLQRRLGSDYDVVAEWRTDDTGQRVPSHIHAEYDPLLILARRAADPPDA